MAEDAGFVVPLFIVLSLLLLTFLIGLFLIFSQSKNEKTLIEKKAQQQQKLFDLKQTVVDLTDKVRVLESSLKPTKEMSPAANQLLNLILESKTSDWVLLNSSYGDCCSSCLRLEKKDINLTCLCQGKNYLFNTYSNGVYNTVTLWPDELQIILAALLPIWRKVVRTNPSGTKGIS